MLRIRHPWLQRLAAGLLDSPIGGLLVQAVLHNLGWAAWRRTTLNERPTFVPEPPRVPQTQATGWPLEEAAQTLLQGSPLSRIHALLQGYKVRAYTPTDVAQALLRAWEKSESDHPPLRAFTQVDPDVVLRQAQNATERRAHGHLLSPIDGTPVAVKDDLHLPPYRTHFGHRETAFTPQRASSALRLWESVGVLFFGKANMHEWAIGATGVNPTQGTARNPYHPQALPGGSSSGSAVAVAAGLVPLALGTDFGGSVRIPAAYCGIYGLKPTYGRVSIAHAGPLVWSLYHIGPMAATVTDLALGLLYLAGPDAYDPTTWAQPPLTFDHWHRESLTGTVIGVPENLNNVHPEIREHVEHTARRLEKAGAEVRTVAFPSDLSSYLLAFLVLVGTEWRINLLRWLRRLQVPVTHLTPATRGLLAAASLFRSEDYLKAAQWRTSLIRRIEHLFQEVHALLLPATGTSAPIVSEDEFHHGSLDPEALFRAIWFVFPANLTGHPALAVPVGLTFSGLPVAVQLLGPYWSEARLLHIAYVLEGGQPPVPPPSRSYRWETFLP